MELFGLEIDQEAAFSSLIVVGHTITVLLAGLTIYDIGMNPYAVSFIVAGLTGVFYLTHRFYRATDSRKIRNYGILILVLDLLLSSAIILILITMNLTLCCAPPVTTEACLSTVEAQCAAYNETGQNGTVPLPRSCSEEILNQSIIEGIGHIESVNFENHSMQCTTPES